MVHLFKFAGKLINLLPSKSILRGTLGICGVAVLGIFFFLYGVAVKKNPSLRCCGDLKPYGVRFLLSKVYGVR